EATLDVRALPDENIPQFVEAMKKVIGDPSVEIIQYDPGNVRPGSPPSRTDTELFHALEAAQRSIYPGAPVIPTMNTGATDNSYLQQRGVQCYGIGPLVDEEDLGKGFGAHSDQERLLEAELYRFLRFNWAVVTSVAGGR